MGHFTHFSCSCKGGICGDFPAASFRRLIRVALNYAPMISVMALTLSQTIKTMMVPMEP